MRPALLLLLALTALGATLLPGARPAAANPLTGVAAISAGLFHTCVLTTAGGVKCWGDNMLGQLGNGRTSASATSTPVDVVGLETGVAAIAAGDVHTCAVTTVGDVSCWGGNLFGQLGTDQSVSCGDSSVGGPAPCSSTPVPVAGLEIGVTAVVGGQGHTCALTTAGGVKCWGSNQVGQLGNGTTGGPTSPSDVVGLMSGATAIGAGAHHTCAVTTAGGVKCWGDGRSGRLGVEAQESCEEPFLGEIVPCSTTPLDVGGLESDAAAVTAGSLHSCALTTAGGVKCWGLNGDAGALGDGRKCGFTCLAPVDVVGLASGVAAVDAGRFAHTCAVTAAGGVKCWGWNPHGELGDGTTVDRATPTDVCQTYDDVRERCTLVLSNAAGIAAGGVHTCALPKSITASVKCWGNNCCGQLGIGSSDFDPHPIPLDALDVKPSPMPTATPTPTPPQGDADCNRMVSSIDALLVLQLDARLLQAVPCPDAADANRDGDLNSIDAALILQRVAGLLDRL